LTPAQEFREAPDWLKQHKRDPFLWLIIAMTLLMFMLNFGAIALLGSAFPSSDAGRAIGLARPIVLETRIFCKLPHGTYLFGYVLGAAVGETPKKVLVCRDMLHGGWVFDKKG
jgi:hypothetical protein